MWDFFIFLPLDERKETSCIADTVCTKAYSASALCSFYFFRESADSAILIFAGEQLAELEARLTVKTVLIRVRCITRF